MSEPPPLNQNPAETLARIEQRLAQQQEKDDARRKRAWAMFGCLMLFMAILLIPVLLIFFSMMFGLVSGMSAIAPK